MFKLFAQNSKPTEKIIKNQLLIALVFTLTHKKKVHDRVFLFTLSCRRPGLLVSSIPSCSCRPSKSSNQSHQLLISNPPRNLPPPAPSTQFVRDQLLPGAQGSGKGGSLVVLAGECRGDSLRFGEDSGSCGVKVGSSGEFLRGIGGKVGSWH